MELNAIHDTLEEIPENYRDLFSEKNGKFECTGIKGLKTQADVDRIDAALNKERGLHKATKATLGVWGDMSHEDTLKALDRIPELEAAAEGKLDEAALDAMANNRADGILRTRLAPLERQINGLTKERDDFAASNVSLSNAATTRSLQDLLRPMMNSAKVLQEHHEDVFLYAEKHLELDPEGGGFFVKEGSQNVTIGATAKDWLEEMIGKRPGWLPPTQGSGARGSGGGGGGFGQKNPWSRESWNLTEQGAVVTQKGAETANRMAEAAGTSVGGRIPEAKG